MRSWVLTMVTAIIFSVLVPGVGLAIDNLVGIFDQGGATNISVAPNTPFQTQLVVIRPVNEAFQDSETGPEYQRAMTSVAGFEMAVIRPTGGFFELSRTYAGDQVDVGTGNDFIVGFGTPVPVVNNAMTLVTFSWMVLDTGPKMVYMGLTTPQSLAGNMVLVDGDDVPRFAMSPVYTGIDLNLPVFAINSQMAAENASWGAVKALYR